MKHLILPLAATITTLLFLVLAPSTNATEADDKTVCDVRGDPLKAGQEYYLVPYNYEDVGGGFTWEPPTFPSVRPPLSCPHFNVHQLKDNKNFGESIAMYPVNKGENIVSLSSKVNIAFTKASLSPRCHTITSNVWKVAPYPDTGVVLGGTKGTEDLSSVFSIEERDDEDGYLIKVCRINSSTTKQECGHLGVYALLGERWLGLNDTYPLSFKFENELSFLQKA